MIRIGIIGAAGLSGQELLFWLNKHSEASIKVVTSSKFQGKKVNQVFPKLVHCDLEFQKNDSDVSDCEVVFLAVPNKASLERVPDLLEQGIRVIDLSGVYRIRNIDVFEKNYRLQHTSPELLSKAVFGLPEFFREQLLDANLVANPGCYPTGSLLGILPFGEFLGELDRPPIIDAKSGVSGAGGRVEDDSINYVNANENFKAYKIFAHQHQPEIQQYLEDLSSYNASESGEVIFTPHLLPVNRGILSTIYLHFRKSLDPIEVYKNFTDFADANDFVNVLPKDELPDLQQAVHSNRCMLGLAHDESAKNWVVVSCIDNLVKGASGQAIQNMNLMFGCKETEGLL